MTNGYYCLIQYCPDFGRAEAANVGLVLFQPEPRAVAVRIVDDAKPAARRLGRPELSQSVLEDARAMHYRLQREPFRSVEDLERFVRTRGNQIQMTAPRWMRIEAIERDADSMFEELVGPTVTPPPTVKEIPLLRRTFTDLAARMPDRVSLGREFHVAHLGFTIRPDYAYQNTILHLVHEMPKSRDLDAMRRDALGLSKEGELVQNLEEGEGKLYVVSQATGAKARENERVFAELLDKFKTTTFVPAAEVAAFARKVEQDLAAH
jgi:hypothetical protein